MVFIPPFDHPLVIAGQGTIGMEILRQCSRPIDAIFVPVGGGGLIAGIAAYVKRLRVRRLPAWDRAGQGCGLGGVGSLDRVCVMSVGSGLLRAVSPGGVHACPRYVTGL